MKGTLQGNVFECKLPYYGIVLKMNVLEERAGSIDPGDLSEPEFDAVTSLILAHACAGINVTDPAYIEGIETVVQSISNNL